MSSSNIARSSPLIRRRLGVAFAVAVIAAVAMGAGALASDDGDLIQPVDNSHNVIDAPSPVSNAVFGTDNSTKPGQRLCTTDSSSAANVNTDCATVAGPHNETSIAINPTNHDNMIGGANDYQLAINPGGQVSETVLSRAHVTFDGGHTWSEYPINFNSAYQATGDPAIAFDADGHAYYATLAFRFVGPTNALNPDVLVANSADGGVTWASVRVAAGSGNFASVGDLLDKEYITAWGHGNALLTFGVFRLGQRGSYIRATLYSSVTHDSGKTWSKPRLISGSLHDAFVAVPAAAADGSAVYAAFMNTDDNTTGRDNYYVVKLDPATGAVTAGPTAVGLVYDGFTDYPYAFGRFTHQDSAYRAWAAGNIAVDPATPSHLALVWSDMRNSTLPANPDPYAGSTNADLVYSVSTDGGATWSLPAPIAISGDQFMPWAAFDGSSRLRIGYFDRSVTPANHAYGYSVGTLDGGWSSTLASTVNSDPTQGTRWFSGATLNAAFPHPTAFLGDYSNIAVVPGTTKVAAYWTDLRNTVCFGSRCGTGEDAYFALLP